MTRVGRVAVVSGVCPACRAFYARPAPQGGAGGWARRWPLLVVACVAVLAALALLTGCQPPDTATAGRAAGCDPSGVRAFQPDHCRSDDDPTLVPDPGVSGTAIWTVALHEAAHKAIADEYGWRVRRVVVRPDATGQVTLAGWGLPCDCPVRLVAWAVAGQVGSPTTVVSPDDQAIVDDALDLVDDADRDRVLAQGRAEAERILGARWGQVERDAQILAERGRL